jgi:hypothetical protein
MLMMDLELVMGLLLLVLELLLALVQGSRLTFSQVTLVPPSFSFSSTKTN